MPFGMNADDLRTYARYSYLGTEMVAPIALGALLDWWLKTSPWGVIVGAVFSLIYMAIRLPRLLQVEEGRGAREKPPAGRR
jgi:F0F1-type ATP synthase assembly protein I